MKTLYTLALARRPSEIAGEVLAALAPVMGETLHDRSDSRWRLNALRIIRVMENASEMPTFRIHRRSPEELASLMLLITLSPRSRAKSDHLFRTTYDRCDVYARDVGRRALSTFADSGRLLAAKTLARPDPQETMP